MTEATQLLLARLMAGARLHAHQRHSNDSLDIHAWLIYCPGTNINIAFLLILFSDFLLMAGGRIYISFGDCVPGQEAY